MSLIIFVLYIIAIVLMYLIIYKTEGKKGIKHPAVDMICFFWPLSLMIMAVTYIEDLLDSP